MKKQSVFYGIILIGIGLLFLAETWQIALTEWWLEWPTILLIIGIAFLMTAIRGRLPIAFLPGVLFLLFGVQLHFVNLIPGWPNHLGMYALILGASLFLDYIKNRSSGWFSGLLLILTGVLYFFETRLYQLSEAAIMSSIPRFAPFVLLAAGLYFLFVKKH
ncbi:LiaI-LiaF-like domain-containing protein [Bacillus piscicola]|uniref:LiaI-LiaF-like domain-containing protein n=1 Tax=Bacillus piscicola TaxID=1632684 RepID=UPI001F0962A4|nr:DUF5668 domain-containing protein [Bacillus piscicola]